MDDTDQITRYAKHTRNFTLGLFLLAFGLFIDFAQDFILPVLLGFFIAITFRPAIRMLARRHVPEWLAAGGFLSVVVIAVAAFVYSIVGPITSFIDNAPAYVKTFGIKLRDLLGSFSAMLNFAEKIKAATEPAGAATQEVVVREGPPIAYLGQITGYSISILATVVLTLVIAAFLMASGDLFYAKLVRVLPTLRDKKTALRIVYDVEREVSAYLLIVTAVNAGLGLAIAVCYYVLGMPSPLMWGAVAFILNFVPYVGAITGILSAGLMAVVSFDSFAYAAVFPLTYAVLNGLENQFVSPLLLGRRLQLNSVAILLALTFWSWIWGIAGTIVAVPVLVTIKVFCDHLDSLAGIGEFLSEKYPEDVPSGQETLVQSAAVIKQ